MLEKNPCIISFNTRRRFSTTYVVHGPDSTTLSIHVLDIDGTKLVHRIPQYAVLYRCIFNESKILSEQKLGSSSLPYIEWRERERRERGSYKEDTIDERESVTTKRTAGTF